MHKFKVGQFVSLKQTAHPSADPRDAYQIVRLMPADDAGQFGYRVKIGGAERAVRESDLSAVVTASKPKGER
jgi:hypothetical protein